MDDTSSRKPKSHISMTRVSKQQLASVVMLKFLPLILCIFSVTKHIFVSEGIILKCNDDKKSCKYIKRICVTYPYNTI